LAKIFVAAAFSKLLNAMSQVYGNCIMKNETAGITLLGFKFQLLLRTELF